MIRPLFSLFILLLATHLRAQTPTWSKDVACIVYSHCTTCHRTDGPAHFELLTYADAYYWRNEMMAATQSRFMPPWPPDPDYRSLAHERVLMQDEIDIIAAWVNGGAPEGDPSQAPEPPQFNGNAVISDPDLSEVMEDFTIPSSTQDLYRCFVLQIDNPTDRYITGMEILPGNSNMVHHVLVFQDTTGQAQQLDAQDPGPGYTNFGGIGVNDAKLIGAWVPGEQPFFTPPGMGIQLFAGADIVMQIHYPATSNVEVDSTRINLQFSDAPFMRPLAIDAVLDHGWTLTNGPLIIPPNEVKTFYNEFTVPFNATITSIAPHAHLVCTSMKSFAVLPSGDTIPLIDIPNWDFRWQGHYSFRNPIYLPQGTVLHGEATYDNTANNPFNPNDPPQWVYLGESTTNEMMLFYFAWTPGLASDVNIVIDDSEHQAHHDDCMPDLLTGVNGLDEIEFDVYPIPAHDRLHVGTAGSTGTIRIIDVTGKIALEQRMIGSTVIDVQHLARGPYSMEFRNDQGVGQRKIILE